MRALLLALLSLPVAASAQQALQPDEPIERTLAAGDAHAYPLTLPAGQFVLGSDDHQIVDVVMTVKGPGSETVQVFDQTRRSSDTV